MNSSVPLPAARAGRREWAALGVLVLVVVLLTVDGTVLYLAIPSMTEDLAPTATQLLWIGDIYAFAIAGLLITMGNVADRIGRKKLLLIGAAGFGVASVIAAFAPTAELLILARVLLGIAGATLMPSTLSIVRSMFADDKQRTLAIAIWSTGATAGAALGPLVGGALLEHFWWGSVFLINVPIMVAVLIAGPILIPESKGAADTPIDLLSSVLSIAAIVPIVFAIKHGVSVGFDWIVVVSAAVGILAGWVFARRQARLPHPLVDLSLFKVPAFAGSVVANGLSIFAFMGLLFFFSQYLQLVRGYGPLQAGAAELPSTIASMAVVTVIGILVAWLGRGRAIGLGLAVGALGLAGIGFTLTWPSYWGIGVFLAVLGLGIGVSMTLTTDAIVSAAPEGRAGAASSIAETAYELGGALGIAVLGSVQLAIYRDKLDLPATTNPADVAAAQESLAVVAATVDDPEVLSHAQNAFTVAVQDTAYIAAGMLLLAGIIAWRVIPSPRGTAAVAGEGSRDAH